MTCSHLFARCDKQDASAHLAVPALSLLAFALFICAGCITGGDCHPALRGASGPSMHSLEVAGVSFRTVEPGRTRGTAEVVFRNGGAEPVAFTDVRFCGRPLWTAPRATRSRLASVFGLGGGGGTTPNATPEEPAWWGFTPSRTVPPGRVT